MRTPSLAVLAILGVIGAAGAARGAGAPLLVSVEVAPGADVSPADVRRSIATELGAPVVGTREPNAADASDVLLVDVESREVRMSLRASAAPAVSRTIAVPADRPGRLRSIGWLAGNLVRDQVGPLVATREAPPAPPIEADATTPPPPLATSAPASSAPAPTSSAAPPLSSAPPATVASRPAFAASALPHPIWSITPSGGPVVTVTRDGGDTSATRSSAFQLEVQRQRSADAMLYGIALALGPDRPRHYVGAAFFAGEAWRAGSWFAEATLGLGLEAIDGLAHIMTTTGTTTGGVQTMSDSWTPVGPMPGLFLRAAGTGGVRLSSAFDLVAQLGAHASSEGYRDSYLGSAIGVRLRLP
jgi:hypothetical protein